MDATRTPTEKLSAALGAIVFFVPLLMNNRTPFVVKYMKHGFVLNLAELVLAVISSLLFGMMGITGLLHFICVVTSLYLAFQAFSGKDTTIEFVLIQAEKLIKTFGLESWFVAK